MSTGLGTSTYNTPQARPFSELKRDVASYVQMPDQAEALVAAGVGINNAIRTLNSRTWNWSLTYTDITLASGTFDYTLPNDFKAVRHIELLNSSGDVTQRIGYMNYKEFLQDFQGSTDSVSPTIATVINAKNSLIISLNYAPGAGFVSASPTMRVRYFKRLPLLVDASDRPDVYGEVENFLTWSAKAYVASVFDPAKYTIAKREAAEVFADLKRDDLTTGYHDWPEDY